MKENEIPTVPRLGDMVKVNGIIWAYERALEGRVWVSVSFPLPNGEILPRVATGANLRQYARFRKQVNLPVRF